MKTFINEKVELNREGSEQSLKTDYCELLKKCLNQTPQGGFDLETMRNRLRVVEVLEKVNLLGQVVLEDADHAIALRCAIQMKWAIMDRSILLFIDALQKAKKKDAGSSKK